MANVDRVGCNGFGGSTPPLSYQITGNVMKERATCKECKKKVVIDSWFHGQGTTIKKCDKCKKKDK